MGKNKKNNDPLPQPSDNNEAKKIPEGSTTKLIYQNTPWSKNSNSIWLASSVNLLRNVEKFKFPAKLPLERKKQIVSLVGKGFSDGIGGCQQPVLLKGEEAGFLDKEYISEHFLSFSSFNQLQQGEGFILDATGEFLTVLNLRDHIQLQLLDCKGELEAAWSRLVKIEIELGKSIHYCFSPKFGFLTADPTQCGTGLLVSIFMHLPGLIHTGQIDPILEKLLDDSLIISGIQGNPTEIIGDILVIQNNFTLGVTEENIISNLRNFATKMLVEEGSARNIFKTDKDPEYKDKVSRAYGILVHSYQIEAIESLNALSLLKLGVECGWVKGITIQRLNEMLFSCRRAHLLHYFHDDKISQEEIPHKRAEYIHKALKDVQLVM